LQKKKEKEKKEVKKTGGLAMDIKGQISVSTLWTMVVLLIMFGVIMQIWNPLYNNLVAPTLANQVHGEIIELMFYLIPLMLVVLILMYPYFESRTGIYRT